MKFDKIIRKIYFFLIFCVLSNLLRIEDEFLYRLLYSVLLVCTGFYFFEKSKEWLYRISVRIGNIKIEIENNN